MVWDLLLSKRFFSGLDELIIIILSPLGCLPLKASESLHESLVFVMCDQFTILFWKSESMACYLYIPIDCKEFVARVARVTLTVHLHPGVPQGVFGTLIPNCMGSCHGQILIETATHSWKLMLCDIDYLEMQCYQRAKNPLVQ